MDKEQFLERYPQINKELLEDYMKAMKERERSSLYFFTALMLHKIRPSTTFELGTFTSDIESLLEEYGIDYIYRKD